MRRKLRPLIRRDADVADDGSFDVTVPIPIRVYSGIAPCPNCRHRLRIVLELVKDEAAPAVLPLKPNAEE